MSDYDSWQAFLASGADASTLIMEIKRRLGVRTDTELAHRLGKTQSAIAQWRRKNRVPETVLLDLESGGDALTARLRDFDLYHESRAVAVRIIAFYVGRVQPNGDLWSACTRGEEALDSIRAAVEDALERLHELTGKPTSELAFQLLTDEGYLLRVVRWIDATDFGDALFAGVIVKPTDVILPELVY